MRKRRSQSPVLVVARDARLSLWRLFWYAIAFALFANVAMGLIFVTCVPPTKAEVCMYSGIALLLFAAPVSRLYPRLRASSLIPFSLMYAMVTFTSNGLLWCVAKWLKELGYEALSPFHRGGTQALTVGVWQLVITVFLGTFCTWALCRWRYGPVVEQDGTLCPSCAYCLLGCVSQVCPECGREFTFQELGTTKQEFTMKRAQQVGAADFSHAD